MKPIIYLFCLLASSSASAGDRIEEAEKLLEAMRAKQSYTIVAEQVKIQLGQDVDFVLNFSDKILSEMANLYADVYTEEELIGIRQFYESKSGQAFLNKKPELTKKYTTLMQQLIQEISLSALQESHNKAK